MQDKTVLVKGILMLLIVPILSVLVPFIFLYFLPSLGIFLLDPTLVLAIVFYTLILFVYWLFQKVSYSEFDVIDKVEIPNIPEDIEKILKTRTRGTNYLANIEIISSLAKRNLPQSRLIEQIQDKGIKLTSTQLIKYLRGLENSGIINSKKGYKREYYLTDEGKWCYGAVKKCFPKRQFWFIVRHYLGYRKLPSFPETTKEKTE